MNYNPNREILKNILFDDIKNITLKGGIELYNQLMNDIEKCIIVDEEDLNIALKNQSVVEKQQP